METLDFKRKIYDQLSSWSKDKNKIPLIVDGLRQVGKSYIVKKFAVENFKNVIIYDFRHNKDLRDIFNGNLDVDTIIKNSIPYFIDANFVPNETILIFEEIGDCPNARTALKSFALDKRYAVIGTGSLLGVLNYRRKNKIDIPTGYEKIIHMSSMDFEEFLWANGLNESAISTLKEYSKKQEQLPEALANYYKEMIKRYVVVGGMPESVKKYLNSNSFIESRNYLEGLIKDYRGDFGRFINDNGVEEVDYKLQSKLNQIFDSIPIQLARETDTNKFKFSLVKSGGRSSEFIEAFDWLERSGLILRCFNLKAIEKPLLLNADNTFFKVFFGDIGLLLACYPLSTSIEYLKDELDSRKGAILENLAAILINKADLPLFYFCNGTNHLEIDFILESANGIILLEEKSTNGRMAASKMVMQNKTPYRALNCYKIIPTNFGKGDFYTTIPQYSVPFLLNDIHDEIIKETKIETLKFPSNL